MGVRDGGGLRSSLALHRKDNFRMSVQITAFFLDMLRYCLWKSIKVIEGVKIITFTFRQKDCLRLHTTNVTKVHGRTATIKETYISIGNKLH